MTRLSLSLGLAALAAVAAARAAELPAELKQAGALRLTVNSTYAPMEYRDPATSGWSGSTSISRTSSPSGSAASRSSGVRRRSPS
jgi:ABC-type amino acid transport substrate-binding protein